MWTNAHVWVERENFMWCSSFALLYVKDSKTEIRGRAYILKSSITITNFSSGGHKKATLLIELYSISL